MKISIIAAKDKNNVIGIDNGLPWFIPEDMKKFKQLTMNNTVIMGRKTYQSIGKSLSGRVNIVISKFYSKVNLTDSIHVCTTLDNALELASYFARVSDQGNNKKAFIIGGSQLYNEAIKHELIDELLITEIDKAYEGDKYFPVIDKNVWKEVSRERLIDKPVVDVVTYIKRV